MRLSVHEVNGMKQVIWNMEKRFLFLLIFSLMFGYAGAQTLHGKVLEINEQGDTIAVVSAALQWLHTAVGTHSDANGEFSLPRSKSDSLVVSFPTYQPDTMWITPTQNDITIFLSHAHSLAEVSVVGRDGSFISTQPIGGSSAAGLP